MAKAKMIQKTMKDPDLINMFNQMVGASDPDADIVIPKYERMCKNVKDILGLMEKMASASYRDWFGDIAKAGFDDIGAFAKKAREEFTQLELPTNNKIYTAEELSAVNSNKKTLEDFMNETNEKYKLSSLIPCYNKLKEAEVVKALIMIARDLKSALMIEQERQKANAHDLKEVKSLSDGFIVNCDGDFLKLFEFSRLDFKQIFINEHMTDEARKYILTILHHIERRAMEIVNDVTSPDVDVEKLSQVLLSNIDEMKKQIPRCDAAFKRISESASLLKQNFGGYYKRFVVSQNKNPGLIVESFIMDVATNGKQDPKVVFQFKQIIQFYKNRTQSKKINDPNVSKMVNLVKDHISIFEGGTKSEKRELDETVEI